MRLVHRVTITIFARPEDTGVEEAIRALAEAKIIVQNVEDGSNKIYTIELVKESETNKFLQFLIKSLGEQTSLLNQQLSSRLHEEEGEFNFYIRLDKNAWLKERKMILTDGGECIHIKLTIAAYPKKIDNAIQVVRKLLGGSTKQGH